MIKEILHRRPTEKNDFLPSFFWLDAWKELDILSVHKVAHVKDFIVMVFSLGNKLSLDQTLLFTSFLGSDSFIHFIFIHVTILRLRHRSSNIAKQTI